MVREDQMKDFETVLSKKVYTEVIDYIYDLYGDTINGLSKDMVLKIIEPFSYANASAIRDFIKVYTDFRVLIHMDSLKLTLLAKKDKNSYKSIW